MRLRCSDGKVRIFSVAFIPKVMTRYGLVPGYAWKEARCEECGQEFGVHDANILKEMFLKHVCMKGAVK